MARDSKMSTTAKTIIGYFIVLALTVVAFQVLNHGFLSARNLKVILDIFTRLAITSMGLTFVIAVGFLDISFPWVGSLGGMTSSFLISMEVPLAWSILGGLVPVLIFGLANGLAIGKYKLPDLITTIGTGAIAFGISNFYTEGSNIYKNFLQSGIMDIYQGKIFGIPHSFYIVSIVMIISYFLLHRSVHGRYMYAIGLNKVSSIFSGIGVNIYVVLAYVLCSVYSFIAVFIMTSAQGSGRIATGETLMIPAYTIVFLGASLFRRPSISGTILASLLISILMDGLTLIGLQFYTKNLLIGTVMLFAIAFSSETLAERVKSVFKADRSSSAN